MDDQGFPQRSIWLKFQPRKRHLAPAARTLYSQSNHRDSTKNCINLSWCVFFLVTSAVNISAQEVTRVSNQPQARALVSESLRYRMLSGTLEVGQVIVNIVNESGGEFIHIIESTSGLLERTTTLLVRQDSTLSPRASHTVRSNAGLSQEIQLQYEAGKVTGAIVQPKRLGGAKEVRASFLSQTQDYYIVPYFLRSCALQVNQVIKFPVYEALGNRVELARGWVVKLEEVEVAAGKFVCYRMEGFTGKLRWIFYFDKKFPHRLIKQKLPALHLETELFEVTPNT